MTGRPPHSDYGHRFDLAGATVVCPQCRDPRVTDDEAKKGSSWVIHGLIALRSMGSAFHANASQAAVPMYASGDQLTQVVGWDFFLMSGAAIAVAASAVELAPSACGLREEPTLRTGL